MEPAEMKELGGCMGLAEMKELEGRGNQQKRKGQGIVQYFKQDH